MRTNVIVSAILVFIGIQSVKAQLNYRLNTDLIPYNYDIYIKPYLLPSDGAKQFTFDGQVNITFRTVRVTLQEIVLHKDDIEIREVLLRDPTGTLVQNVSLTTMSYETATDKLTIPLQNFLTPNVNYTLSLKYEGQIRDGMEGVFRVNTTDPKGYS